MTKSKGPRFGIANQAERIFRSAQVAFIIVAGTFLVLWSFDPLRTALIDRGWVSDNTAIAVSGAVVAVTTSVLIGLELSIRRLSDHVSLFQPSDGVEVVIGGVRSIYPYITDACDAVDDRRQRTLEVLGLTLYTAWPLLHPWFASEDVRNWSFRLWCLSPDFIDQQEYMPPKWSKEARVQIDAIREYADTHAEELRHRNVSVRVATYDFFPGIHGFRIGDGTLFMSSVHWDLSSPEKLVLDDPHQPYVVIRGGDRSALASSFRALFANWIERAEIGSTISANRGTVEERR